MRNLILSTILIFLFLSILGCSSHPSKWNGYPGYDPTLPNDGVPILPGDDLVPSQQTSIDDVNDSNRKLMGQWFIVFDLKTLKVKSVFQRANEAHVNLTTLLAAPGITINSFNHSTHILDADFNLTNSLDTDLFDVRLIVYTDDAGHKLLNPDNWTGIYDIPEGNSINPFKAYAKDQPQRIFTKDVTLSENLQIYLPDDYDSIIIAFDGCYPDNCTEPYSIENFTQGELLDYDDTSTPVEITVKDWQNDVSRVSLFCPDISGDTPVPFSQSSGDKWKAELVNLENAQAGNYNAVITAESSNSGSLALYDQVIVCVTKADPPVNAKVVAEMPGLYVINDFVVRGDLIYVADGKYGLKIADISDPDHLKILSELPLGSSSYEILINENFAFVKVEDLKLVMIDISDPVNPRKVSEIETKWSYNFTVSGKHVFIADSPKGPMVININDPSNPVLENYIYLPVSYNNSDVISLSVKDDYLYLCCRGSLFIISISSPVFPVIGTLEHVGASKILINDDFAYLCSWSHIYIIDISNPRLPYLISQTIGYDNLRDFVYSNNHILCTMDWNWSHPGQEFKLVVLNVEDPFAPEIMLEYETQWRLDEMYVLDGILYVSSQRIGFFKINISDPENLEIIAEMEGNAPSSCIAFRNSYVYTFPGIRLDNYRRIDILDVSVPTNPKARSRLNITDGPILSMKNNISCNGNLLYLTNGKDLKIFDINNPESPQSLSLTQTGNNIFSLITEGATAFLGTGVSITSIGSFDTYDISTPSAPVLNSSTQLNGVAQQITVSGDWAYVPLDTGSLAILDISNPNEASIMGSLDLGFRAIHIAVKDKVVYVSSNAKTKIIDVSNPMNPQYIADLEHHMMKPTILKTIIHGTSLYIGYDDYGLSIGGIAIYDVSDPACPQFTSYLLFGSDCSDITVHGNYAYVTASTEGIKVIQLRE